MATIQWAEWRPDVAPLNSAYAGDIMNVLCADGSYIPFPQLVPFSNPIESTPYGAFSAKDSDGQIVVFAGTAGKLWKLNTTTLNFEDVSKAATTYNSTEAERWRFAQYGDYVIAVNANDNPQVFELGISTKFTDLGGSPPRARHVAVWGDFLALGGLTDFPSRVHWSALNDITGWTPGTNNSDYQDFPDGGDVSGMTSATNPIIFQRSAIRLGTFYPGSTEVFGFQKVHDRRGAVSPYAIASRGAFTFFNDAGGFFQVGPDGSLAPIGYEKVDRTVFGMIDGAELYGIMAEVDPFYSRVYVAVRYDSTSVAFDRLLIFDWNLNRWSQVGGEGFQILFPLSSGTIGYTLEGLDAIAASLEDLPFSLDSKVWQGGAPIMAAFDANNRLGFFSGSAAEATLTTQEMGSLNGGITLVKSLYPVADTSSVFVSIGARFRRCDPVVWTSEQSPSSNTGMTHKKSRARFHQFKLRIPAGTDWHHTQGMEVISQPAGMR